MDWDKFCVSSLKDIPDARREDHMIFLGPNKDPKTRRSFRCEECGCNVFRKPQPYTDPLLYKCNGCGTRWRGEA